MKLQQCQKARFLRRKGYSLNEISVQLKISKSSASIWVKDVEMSHSARARIAAKFIAGQKASQLKKKEQTIQKQKLADSFANDVLNNSIFNTNTHKVICSMVYYCEGGKDIRTGVRFTNSDPQLIKTFLNLFRESFKIDEKRLRACVHLHSYHDKDAQLKFWSKMARIPTQQFIRPYLKITSGQYKKEGYQGCVSIRYSDAKIARELKALALAYMKRGL